MVRGGGAFSSEEMQLLRGLPAVANVTRDRITYSDIFKQVCTIRYLAGESPTKIFREAGLPPDLVGYKRIERSVARWKESALKSVNGSEEMSNAELISQLIERYKQVLVTKQNLDSIAKSIAAGDDSAGGSVGGSVSGPAGSSADAVLNGAFSGDSNGVLPEGTLPNGAFAGDAVSGGLTFGKVGAAVANAADDANDVSVGSASNVANAANAGGVGGVSELYWPSGLFGRQQGSANMIDAGTAGIIIKQQARRIDELEKANAKLREQVG